LAIGAGTGWAWRLTAWGVLLTAAVGACSCPPTVIVAHCAPLLRRTDT
jgi:hypothetical protein